MSRPRKQEQGEFALMDQLYEANTKVEALLGVKKALEINLQLYQTDVTALTEQLEEAQNKTDVMESERQTMVAEHHAATSQLHTLQLAHAALCAKYAELQIKHAHQKEHVETQSVELLSFQRDATKQLLADSAVEARKEARMAEITTLRRSLSEANRRLETAEACTAAVVRAGFDPAVFAASNSEITQATIDILRDQLQNVVVDGGAGAAAQGGQGGAQAAPAILGMLLGNLDGGAAIVQQHPELVGLVQNWMGGGGLSPAQIHQASLKAGLDPALADNLRIAATMLPTASGSANGLDPRALSAILTMLASVAPGQLEQLGVTPEKIGPLHEAVERALKTDGAVPLETITTLVKEHTGMDPTQLVEAVAPIIRQQLGFDPAQFQGLFSSVGAAAPSGDSASTAPQAASPGPTGGTASHSAATEPHPPTPGDAVSLDDTFETLQAMTGLVMRDRASVSPSPFASDDNEVDRMSPPKAASSPVLPPLTEGPTLDLD